MYISRGKARAGRIVVYGSEHELVVDVNDFKECGVVADLHLETDHGPILRDRVHSIAHIDVVEPGSTRAQPFTGPRKVVVLPLEATSIASRPIVEVDWLATWSARRRAGPRINSASAATGPAPRPPTRLMTLVVSQAPSSMPMGRPVGGCSAS